MQYAFNKSEKVVPFAAAAFINSDPDTGPLSFTYWAYEEANLYYKIESSHYPAVHIYVLIIWFYFDLN